MTFSPHPIRLAAPLDQLKLESRREDHGLTLIVRGEIDLASAPALDRGLQQAETVKPRRIVLDLAALDFIDAAGIRVLIQAQQRANISGHELVLTRVPAQTQRLFSIAGINGDLSIE